MTAPQLSPANAAQFAHWNGAAGELWVALQDRLDAQFVALSAKAMDLAKVRPGERVLDVGCGTGFTTIELARRVAPGGEVLGLDLSQPMLELGRRRAAEASVAARFEQGDAQVARLVPESFDLVFSRFGVMFFADPAAAFANLRAALKPGGRIAFICWRAVGENPWVSVPMAAAFEHVPRPPAPEPGAPGEFAFADAKRVRRILEEAGFADIAIDPIEAAIGAPSLEAYVDMTMRMGLVGSALREAPDKAEAVRAAVRQALAPFEGAGGIEMTAAVWFVTATK